MERIKVGVGASPWPEEPSLRDIELIRAHSAEELIELLASGRVDALVRGGLGAREVMSYLRDRFGCRGSRLLLMQRGPRLMAMGPVGVDDVVENDVEDLVRYISASVSFYRHHRSSLAAITGTGVPGDRLRVHLMAYGRKGDRGRSHEVDASFELMEDVGKILSSTVDAVDVVGVDILLEDALLGDDLIIFPGGHIGNLVFRALFFGGEMLSWGAPVVDMPGIYIDTTSSRKVLDLPLRLAAGLARDGMS